MGYLGNHLATVATGAFAAVLTGLWPWFLGFAPVLNFVFVMAVTITWFLTFACWFSQRSADYVKSLNAEHAVHQEAMHENGTKTGATVQTYRSNGSITEPKLNEEKTILSTELDELRDTVRIQDSEIERLRKEITNLQTRVQVESLRAELANIKAMAAKK